MRLPHLLAAITSLLATQCDRGAAAPSSAASLEGSGGAVTVVDCADAAAMAQVVASAGSPRRVLGSNGAFADSCGPDGNLVKYTCELAGPCQVQGPCTQTLTGKVVSHAVDCGGTCSGGACIARCPAVGEQLSYTSAAADGSATLESPSTHRSFACTLASVVVDPSYDCHATPKVGLTVYVTDPGDAGMYCSVRSIRLTVGSTAVDSHCVYDCQVPP